jgi:hypothetical protein
MDQRVTRLFDPPRSVDMDLDQQGVPSRVDGMPVLPTHRWLVDVDWWRRPVAREYWRVVVGDSVLCEVYRDLERDSWYLERVFD